MITLTRFRYGVAISLVIFAALIMLGFVVAATGHADARLIQAIRSLLAPGLVVLFILLLISNVIASFKMKHTS